MVNTQFLAVVLVARTSLGIPQASSPVTLPEWFPILPSQQIYTTIRDITWTPRIPLNAPAVAIPEISKHLYDLEGEVLNRLIAADAADSRAGQALLSCFGTLPGTSRYRDFLQQAQQARSSVRNPSAFRPSIRQGSSLIANLWYLGTKSSQEKLPSHARRLNQALALDGLTIELPLLQPLVAVLLRPSQPDSTPGCQMARVLLSTVTFSCQLVTVSAHSDAYPALPALLIQSFSLDLRESLAGLSTTIRSASVIAST